MSFSPAWENLYSTGRHISVWPWSDLVSLVMRYANRTQPLKVLELGTGAGANVPFFLSLGFDYYGVEGSASAVQMLRDKFGEKAKFSVGDFCEEIPFAGPFDIVVDRGSITHNDSYGVQKALRLTHQVLRPDGLFVGVTWFSPECSCYGAGASTADRNVRRDFREGFLENTGVVHFADKETIMNAFKSFDLMHLELRRTEIHLPKPETIAAWNIVARKR